MRIEIAIRAFAHAPRDMDIQRQRRQGLEIHGLRFEADGSKNLCSHSDWSLCNNTFSALPLWLIACFCSRSSCALVLLNSGSQNSGS